MYWHEPIRAFEERQRNLTRLLISSEILAQLLALRNPRPWACRGWRHDSYSLRLPHLDFWDLLILWSNGLCNETVAQILYRKAFCSWNLSNDIYSQRRRLGVCGVRTHLTCSREGPGAWSERNFGAICVYALTIARGAPSILTSLCTSVYLSGVKVSLWRYWPSMTLTSIFKLPSISSRLLPKKKAKVIYDDDTNVSPGRQERGVGCRRWAEKCCGTIS